MTQGPLDGKLASRDSSSRLFPKPKLCLTTVMGGRGEKEIIIIMITGNIG